MKTKARAKKEVVILQAFSVSNPFGGNISEVGETVDERGKARVTFAYRVDSVALAEDKQSDLLNMRCFLRLRPRDEFQVWFSGIPKSMLSYEVRQIKEWAGLFLLPKNRDLLAHLSEYSGSHLTNAYSCTEVIREGHNSGMAELKFDEEKYSRFANAWKVARGLKPTVRSKPSDRMFVEVEG